MKDKVKGEMHIEINAPDGTIIYRGNGKETTDFTVDFLQRLSSEIE